MLNFTLKTKVTIVFPTLITIALACVLFFIYSTLQSYIKNNISEHQFQVVSLLADEVDGNIADNHETLAIIAGRVTPEMVASPQLALKYMKSQSEHFKYFDNGLYLFDHQGRIVADTASGLARTGQDYTFRNYLKQTIASRKPVMSDPFESAQSHHHPAMTFTVPVFEKGGALIAVLGGSVDLNHFSPVEKLSRIKLGKGGYVYIYNKERMIISHPDKTRIMKRDVPLGVNKLFDRAIDGFEGTGETVTSRGLHALSSFKHLKTKNWIIAANYPVTAVYAPLDKLKNAFLFALPLLSLGTFCFMRIVLKRLADPVVDLTRHVESIHQKKGNDRMYPTQAGDEVAVLGRAFNRLILENDRQRDKLLIDLERQEQIDSHLKLQNEYLSVLHETTVKLISRHGVDELLRTIVTRAGSLLGTEHCYVYLKNATGTEMEMVFQSGIFDSFSHYPIKPGQGVAGFVWNSGEPFQVDDYNLWEGRLISPDRDPLHAMAGVPLKAGAEVVGVLGLAFVENGTRFDDMQMELLSRFGELASLSLENARLNEESRRELAERKKAEEHLRKLSVAVEQSPASIIITDTFGRIEYVNPQFTLLTGYSNDEVLGKNPGILKSGETSQEEYRLLWEAILSGREWRGEFHNRKKDGGLYWEQALIAPIRGENDETTHFICIKEDITERKQLENQLHHSQKMEAIGQLAGGIAHDFNNILTAIIGYSSIIQLKLPADSPLKKFTCQIEATAERGAKLTQGLLAFSRKQVSTLHSVDLNQVLVRVQELLLRLISEDINLELALASKSLPVMADTVQLEQVLMNLVTNARDAMPNGGSITITTEAIYVDSEFVNTNGFGQYGNYALLTLTDSGEGMTADIVEHIFEPFYTTKELGKGTGLGLSIVYGIIKKHNGYIVCQSAVGTGTSLQIYLPILSETFVPDPLTTSAIMPLSQRGDVILVAEDDETARILNKEILEDFGYSVLEAKDGQEAVELFRDNRENISLLMLDVIMPKLNGSEVYDAVRALDPLVKVLFCSGYSEDVVVRQCGLKNGLDYLSKPYSPKELLMKISEVLDNDH